MKTMIEILKFDGDNVFLNNGEVLKMTKDAEPCYMSGRCDPDNYFVGEAISPSGNVYEIIWYFEDYENTEDYFNGIDWDNIDLMEIKLITE